MCFLPCGLRRGRLASFPVSRETEWAVLQRRRVHEARRSPRRPGRAAGRASAMQRLRTTFKRSRTPTGAEMKTQSSLEVPKQVRSASFDEIQLEAKRSQQQQAGGADHFLKVPPHYVGQRSRSFDDDSSTAASIMHLEVPPRRFQRRRSSGDKATALCVHCVLLEEFARRSSEEASASASCSLSYSDTSSSSAESGDDDVDDDGLTDARSPCSITVTPSPTLLECPAPPHLDEESAYPSSRRRSVTKLSRQEAFVEPGSNSLENVVDVGGGGGDTGVSDIYLAVPELRRDRAASVDSCFSKVASHSRAEEVPPPPPDSLLLLAPPPPAGGGVSSLRSRSVDIVLPTDAQAHYKALAMSASVPPPAPPPSAAAR